MNVNQFVKHNIHGVDTSVAIRIDYDKCVGCQMCAKACMDQQKIGSLGVAPLRTPPYLHSVTGKNHENTETSRVKMMDTNCIGCGQCAVNCSTGAMQPANKCSDIQVAKAQGLTLVAVMAPSTRVGVAEAMGMGIGFSAEAQTVAGLRQLGFHYVFDNLWGADLTTIEDAKEVLKFREAGKGPVFTSCCPAWINLVETKYPEVIPNVSTARSPTGMTCAVIKKFWAKQINKRPEDIFVVGVMPCTAKKFEAIRPQLMTENVKDCDLSITTREVVELFKEERLVFSEEREQKLRNVQEGQFDAPFNVYSGSSYLFGRTGGVTESVVRYMCALNKEQFTPSVIQNNLLWESTDKFQSLRVFEFPCGGSNYRAIVCHGGAAVEELMKIHAAGKLKGVDVVEVMVCPQGCVGGGGQPKIGKKSLTAQRPAGLDKHDKESQFADCQSNALMHEMVKKWMPTEHNIHDALHTHYDNRRMK
ncbi:FeFe-hydrogenase_1 [Hexamita inflata]|uniref:FeFe-hydrogenase 1 n=1 Tax=Hexamita inflata TaxID=28002 RepID=A0AA86V433_9EUKA|nr:FeFe-hydrogenase 1 [Hexamita inflata]